VPASSLLRWAVFRPRAPAVALCSAGRTRFPMAQDSGRSHHDTCSSAGSDRRRDTAAMAFMGRWQDARLRNRLVPGPLSRRRILLQRVFAPVQPRPLPRSPRVPDTDVLFQTRAAAALDVRVEMEHLHRLTVVTLRPASLCVPGGGARAPRCAVGASARSSSLLPRAGLRISEAQSSRSDDAPQSSRSM
jgi:hypothetical protein